MSIRLLNLVWDTEINLFPNEHHVLLCLANFANEAKGSICWPSINTIAKKCHLSRRQTIRILNNLSTSGIINKEIRLTKRNNHESNIYSINEENLMSTEKILPSDMATLGWCHGDTRGSDMVTPNTLNRNISDTKETKAKKNSSSDNLSSSSSVLRNTAKLVIDFLRQKTGRNYQHVDSTLKPILQLLKDGITLEQCKAVIIRKQREWGNNKEMEKYLRPSTLFRKSNFYDKYLPELVTEEEKKNIMKKG